jgi:hypothetical protein
MNFQMPSQLDYLAQGSPFTTFAVPQCPPLSVPFSFPNKHQFVTLLLRLGSGFSALNFIVQIYASESLFTWKFPLLMTFSISLCLLMGSPHNSFFLFYNSSLLYSLKPLSTTPVCSLFFLPPEGSQFPDICGSIMEIEVGTCCTLADILQLSQPFLHTSIIMGGWLLNYQPPSLIDFWENGKREFKIDFLAIRKNGSLVKVNFLVGKIIPQSPHQFPLMVSWLVLVLHPSVSLLGKFFIN